MNNSWNWIKFSEKEPEIDKFIYIYDIKENIIHIDKTKWLNEEFLQNDYWAYVFMPDPPKIENEKTLSEKIKELESRIIKLEKLK